MTISEESGQEHTLLLAQGFPNSGRTNAWVCSLGKEAASRTCFTNKVCYFLAWFTAMWALWVGNGVKADMREFPCLNSGHTGLRGH